MNEKIGARLRRRSTQVDLADLLQWQLRALKIPLPMREFAFDPDRRWRFDLAWVDAMLFVDVQGGEWITGRRSHGSGAGMNADYRKWNAAAKQGWTGLLFTGSMVRSGEAVAELEELLRS